MFNSHQIFMILNPNIGNGKETEIFYLSFLVFARRNYEVWSDTL